MKYHFLVAIACCTITGLALGADPPQKKAAAPSHQSAPAVVQKNTAKKNVAQKAVAKQSAPAVKATPRSSTASRSTTGHPATTGSKVSKSRGRYASYRPPVRRPAAQQAPTADRYREIQDALAAQGYLKTPSSGIWDKDSIDAMQRFQKDKNLDPTGKLTARSLGELGLGPKPQGSVSLPANPTASLSANPGSESTPLQ